MSRKKGKIICKLVHCNVLSESWDGCLPWSAEERFLCFCFWIRHAQVTTQLATGLRYWEHQQEGSGGTRLERLQSRPREARGGQGSAKRETQRQCGKCSPVGLADDSGWAPRFRKGTEQAWKETVTMPFNSVAGAQELLVEWITHPLKTYLDLEDNPVNC